MSTAGDRRETLADVAEQILRDQLGNAQEELDRVLEQKQSLEEEKCALQQQKELLTNERTQIELTWRQAQQVNFKRYWQKQSCSCAVFS